MNTLIENNYISEMECGSNFAYILSENSTFLPLLFLQEKISGWASIPQNG